MTYSDKLKSPKWQKKRLEILNRDNFKCKFCGDIDSTLHVHHISYSEGEPWEIEDNLLITLCYECHENESESIKEASKTLILDLKKIGFTSYQMIDLSFFMDELLKVIRIEDLDFNFLKFVLLNKKIINSEMKRYNKIMDDYYKNVVNKNRGIDIKRGELF